MPSPGSSKGTAPSRTKQKRAARRATASAVSAAREIPPTSCPRYHRVTVPVPPLAPRVPKVDVIHGERREDDYFWLRDKDDPHVTAYLQAENAYTVGVMQPTETFQEALYKEILGRIKEDDTTVPYRRGNHFYYSRTEKGKQYPIHCRKADRPLRLWRHRLGEPTDALLYEEPDELFRVHVWRSRSRAWLFAASRSFTSAEVRYAPAADPGGAWKTLLEREKDHEYDVDHGVGPEGDVFYIRTNGLRLRNFRQGR